MSKFIGTCDWCDTQFETEWETKLYCSRQHKELAREYRKRFRQGRVRLTHQVTCPVCNIEFATTNQKKIYCSTGCATWLKEQRRRETKQKQWSAKNTPLLKARIYYRDKGICQLCQQPIDLTLTYPNPMMFSVDHITPRSKGGGHTLGNLQATHLLCNTKRGNKDLNTH